MFEIIAGLFCIVVGLAVTAFYLKLDGIIETWKQIKNVFRR